MMRYTYTNSSLDEVKKLAESYANKEIDIYALAEKIIGIWKSCTQTTLNWKVLKYVADTHIDNSDIDHIRAKLYILNKLYHSNPWDIDNLSKIIATKALNFTLANNKEDLLISFQSIIDESHKANTVTLSKYFALHSPTVFPIQDRLAIKALNKLITKENYLEQYLKEKKLIKDPDAKLSYIETFNKIATTKQSVCTLPYMVYISIVDYFQKEKKLTCNYRKLDKFLWLYGMTL